MPDKKYLQELQSLPLYLKVSLTKQRLREWINYYGLDGVYVSFSGGKDSTVLLYIARSEYPDIKAVFSDTGLEFPEIRQFVSSFNNVDWVKPEMNFKDVICTYGYPFISKEVCETVHSAKSYLQEIATEIDSTPEEILISLNNKTNIAKLKQMTNIMEIRRKNHRGGANVRLARLLGLLSIDNNITLDIKSVNKSIYNQNKWQFLLTAPFIIGNQCCQIMKKNPLHKYNQQTGRVGITAQMASESLTRTQQWLKNGCNGFNLKYPISNPMSFWTEQDVLLYIKQNNISIASVYGDIINETGTEDDIYNYKDKGIFEINRPCLKTTLCDRTGCAFCGFGVHMEKQSRFDLIDKVSSPNLREYVLRGGSFDNNGLWKPNNEGLGYWFVMQYINIYGNLNLYIPDYAHYEKKYGNEMTKKYLVKEYLTSNN